MTFPITRWTLISRLSSPGLKDEALSELCSRYWWPVYSFLRRSGKGREDAEDACQNFFASLLRADLFARADRQRGRLRTFLLGTLEQFMANDCRMGKALKRSPAGGVWSLDDPLVCGELDRRASACASPAEAFDGAWLGQLMERAVEGVRSQYEKQGKELLFESLFPALMDQALEPQEAQARVAGLSVSHFRVQLHRLRARYRRSLLDEVAATVGEEGDPEAELRWLFSLSPSRV